MKAEFVARGEADGLSQRKMAEAMGWTPGTLNQYLLANVPVNYDALFKCCEYLKVSPHAIDPTLQERVAPPPNKDDLRLMLKKIPPETALEIIRELGQSLTDSQKK
ncbi:MAG: XRE family transcriptional regulator, partial [Euryarchaeota archaeon]|nr:XRE family transcriptional regulator [Euryarchaeota archaeon]